MSKIDRREFMKLGGAAVAACSMGSLFSACSGSSGSSLSSEPIVRTLHFHLLRDNFLSDKETYQLHVAGIRHLLKPHTLETLLEHGHTEDTATHYASDVILPGDRAIHIYVTQRSDVEGTIRNNHGHQVDHGLALSMIHIPEAALGLKGSSARSLGGLGLQMRNDSAAELTPENLGSFHPPDVARTIIFHHSNLLAIDADIAKTVLAHISEAPGFNDLVEVINGMGQHGWYTMKPVLGENDKPVTRKSDGSTVYQYITKQKVLDAGAKVLENALNAVYNDPAFQSIAYSGKLSGGSREDTLSTAATVVSTKNRSASAGSQGTTYSLSGKGNHPGVTMDLKAAGDGKITLSFKNNYVRHLSAFIEFLDVDGNPVVPENWNPLASLLDDDTVKRLTTKTRYFLSLINPPTTFMTESVFDAEADVTFKFPENATQARLLLGGVGNGGERISDVEEVGVALTSVFELGLPAILLAAASGLHKEGPKISKLFLSAGLVSGISKLFFSIIWSEGSHSAKAIFERGAIFLADILYKKGLQILLDFIIAEETESATEDAIPFIGWAMNAVAIGTTAVQLGRTTAEVVASPWVMEEGLTVTHNVTVVVDHDPKDFEFPATATHFDAFLEFSGSDRVEKRVELPATTVSDPISVTFENVPRGGKVKAVVYFYSDTDWLAGLAVKENITNLNPSGSNELQVNLVLKEQLVPLSKDTIYHHKESTVADGGGFKWSAGSAPTATEKDLNATAAAGSLTSLSSVSVNQTLGRLSYGWQSFRGSVPNCSGSTGNLGYSYRTIGLGQNPNSGAKFSSCYDATPSLVQNELFTAEDGSGDNYIIAPSGDGRFVVKRFALDSSSSYETSGILGVFPTRPDKVRAFPQNRIVGISQAFQKIYYLKLSSTAVSLADAPEATLMSGPGFSLSNVQANPSLLLAPRTFDIGLGQSLIILEVNPSAPNSPGFLRAFSQTGLPMGYFGNNKSHSVSLKSDITNITYLDIAIESKGYIYVLAKKGVGELAEDYFIDLYTPDGTYLSRTEGISAAQMSLDAWRNIYTLNYEAIEGPQGNTEPSVSQWIPSTPQGTEKPS